MKRIFTTKKQLLNECPVGYQIMGYVDLHSVEGKTWELRMVMCDELNENKYRAEYDVPDDPGSCLCFTYELRPKEFPGYHCELVKKFYNGQDHTS